MSLRLVRAVGSLLLCGIILSVGGTESKADSLSIPALMKPRYRALGIIGGFRTKHTSTWDRWYAARQTLGAPKANESYVRATAPGLQTEGTAMRFSNGMVTRISTAPRAGRTTVLFGGIFNKYEELGGLHGTLGFPIGDPYQLGQSGDYAQIFEKGQIYWNTTKRAYDVRYFPQ